jgi:hypothetical protein
VHFARAPQGVLRNYGEITAQTALAAAVTFKSTYFTVDSTTGFVVGQLVTLGDPGGKDENAEEVRISAINSGTGRITIEELGGLRYDHAQGDLVTEARDMYPLIFMVDGIQPFGKGTVIPPYVGVSPIVDKMSRIFSIFWYGILGYGTIRPWAAWLVWVAAPPYTKLGRV